MNTERLFNVVLLELSTEKLTIEDALEQTLVSSEDITNKSHKIKQLVARLATVETSIERFNTMVSNNNDNENKKTN
jgi:uncharacterized protein YoxC